MPLWMILSKNEQNEISEQTKVTFAFAGPLPLLMAKSLKILVIEIFYLCFNRDYFSRYWNEDMHVISNSFNAI